MKNRLSSHFFVFLLLLGVEIVGYVAIHRAGLIRGYETSWIGGGRDLLMFLPITLITGIFGMNVSGLPGVQGSNGFDGVMVLMLATVVVSLCLLYWKKLF